MAPYRAKGTEARLEAGANRAVLDGQFFLGFGLRGGFEHNATRRSDLPRLRPGPRQRLSHEAELEAASSAADFGLRVMVMVRAWREYYHGERSTMT